MIYLLQYLYEVQLHLASLPFGEAQEILLTVESDLLERIDAFAAENQVGAASAERAVVEDMMRPKALAAQYIAAYERRVARDFATESAASYVLAAAALFAAVYDHSITAIVLAGLASLLVVARAVFQVMPARTKVVTYFVPACSVLATIAGLAALVSLAIDLPVFTATVQIARHHADAFVIMRGIPLRDLSHVLVTILAYISRRSAENFQLARRQLRDHRHLRSRTAAWRTHRLTWPSAPERNDVDGFYELRNQTYERVRDAVEPSDE